MDLLWFAEELDMYARGLGRDIERGYSDPEVTVRRHIAGLNELRDRMANAAGEVGGRQQEVWG
jgi:hypothetical protein